MVEDYRTALARFGSSRRDVTSRAGAGRAGAVSGRVGAGSGRKGLSTGSCACAAATAAARALAGLDPEPWVTIRLPDSAKPWSGLMVRVPVAELNLDGGEARAVVIKDSGDDSDITNGMPVVALVRWSVNQGITLHGGKGVGRVTRPGLPVRPGEPAINPVPREMIRHSLEALAGGRGMDVFIELPWGEKLAAKTWNPRIGVEGGLSVIGTSGVVEPASSAAYRRSLLVTLKAYRARGLRSLWLGPGYVSERYLDALGVPENESIVVGDHFGFALDVCKRLGFSEVMIAAHAGKLLKLAAGIFNTHARYGDGRLETLAACAAAAGAPSELVQVVLDCALAEEACTVLEAAGLCRAFDLAAARAAERAARRSGLPVRCILLNLDGKALGSGEAGGHK